MVQVDLLSHASCVPLGHLVMFVFRNCNTNSDINDDTYNNTNANVVKYAISDRHSFANSNRHSNSNSNSNTYAVLHLPR